MFSKFSATILVAFVPFLLSGCGITSRVVSISAANGEKLIATIEGKKVQLPAENIQITKGEIIYIYNADNPGYKDSAIREDLVNGLYNTKDTNLSIPVYPIYEQGGGR